MGAEQSPWITSAYALPSTRFALFFGRPADVLSRRRALWPAWCCSPRVTSIVAYRVAVTSVLADGDRGLATGLTTMTQQVAISVGIPILSAIAATRSVDLTGVYPALIVDVVATLGDSGARHDRCARPQRLGQLLLFSRAAGPGHLTQRSRSTYSYAT
jgi:MFS family permease